MFRNRKYEFVSSAFGPNHEGGSKKIRRLQRETERGPEEGKMYKQHFILCNLLIKSEVCHICITSVTKWKDFSYLEKVIR